MLLELLGLPETPFHQLLATTLGGMVFYFGVSGLSYLIFFVWGRSRFHPTYEANPEELAKQRKWGALGVLGNAVLMVPFQMLVVGGHSQIYWDVGEHGWGWLVLSFVLYLTFTETCIYWIHRALHWGPLYEHLHSIHHEWRATTSWVSMAFHPLDSFAQALPHHLMIFLLPVHGGIYFVMLTFVSVWSVIIHDRVSLFRWNVVNYTGHHTLHHWYYDCNYGQFLTVWDRLMGTWRDPAVAAEKDPSIPEGLLR